MPLFSWNTGKNILNRLTGLEDTYVKALWFEQIEAGTTGMVALPTGATIDLDEWPSGVDALASTIEGGLPTFEQPSTSLWLPITATMDSLGNWTFSGTPSAYPVAVVYVYKVKLSQLDITKTLGGVEVVQDVTEVHLTPKPSSSGPEGTMFYCSADNQIYVATE